MDKDPNVNAQSRTRAPTFVSLTRKAFVILNHLPSLLNLVAFEYLPFSKFKISMKRIDYQDITKI